MPPVRVALRRLGSAAAIALWCTLLLLLAPPRVFFSVMAPASFKARVVVVSQWRDCADAARLARRKLARNGESRTVAMALVALGGEADRSLLVNGVHVPVVSKTRRRLIEVWLTARGAEQTPVLIGNSFNPTTPLIQLSAME